MILKRVELPGITLVARGKVRDIFQVSMATARTPGLDGETERLLIVATDRLSAFDVVLPDPIPDKGRVLTQLSKFWFERFSGLVPSHMITTDVDEFPAELGRFREQLAGRSMLVYRTRPLPVECVVRGYLAGSGWKEYQKTGAVCGIKLPAGLRQAEQLPEPLFTPSTKAQTGHDENITQAELERIVGTSLGRQVRDVSLEIYSQAAEYARNRGIIVADTKFEFGLLDDRLIWIDEALTPDSSRFWDESEYRVGEPPRSFDKQFVRDYLETLGWDKSPPGPRLPPEVIAGTSERYREAYRRLTGIDLC
ncbi:MAG: phosphoribosylaminoimidazolesuccinocarboxamide synthase [candidate division WOR-3 bacterium]